MEEQLLLFQKDVFLATDPSKQVITQIYPKLSIFSIVEK